MVEVAHTEFTERVRRAATVNFKSGFKTIPLVDINFIEN
jgi:hypothetical protein